MTAPTIGGCAFLDLGANELDSLRRTVQAAIGLSEAFIRDWDEIHRESSLQPEVQVLVGRTPSGQDICLAPADCVELGQDGVGLFVRTVASLENA